MEQCVSNADMILTIAQTFAQGWHISTATDQVTFVRPDGVSFLWSWLEAVGQWCMGVNV